MRDDLPPAPARIARLPCDHRGFPVPWFVQWFDDNGKACEVGRGVPDFRVVDARKVTVAVRQRRCWVCGDTLGRHLAFVIGPMCAINRTISEPPLHRDCAIWSARACPFLSRPRMRRNAKGITEEHIPAAGLHLDRNPGVACVWVTKSFRPFRPPVGHDGVLFKLGDPEEVLWFAEGRRATRNEVMDSIESGLPTLQQVARAEGRDAFFELERLVAQAMPLVPAAA